MPGPQSNHTQITAAFKQQFHDSFELACQQKKSALESTVTSRGAIVGSSFTINDLGKVSMRKRTSADRFTDTNLVVPDAGTRVALMSDYDLHVPLEVFDIPKLSAAPDNAYMQLMVAAANRAKDELIFAELTNPIGRRTADNPRGGTALTNVSLPTSQIINAPATTTTAPAEKLTKSLLIQIRSRFRKNECDDEELFIIYNSNMLSSILADPDLTSADYMSVQMLQQGAVANKFLGFTWVPYEGVTEITDGASNPKTLGFTSAAYCKSALHFGTGKDYSTDIGTRYDMNNIKQLSAMMSYGAGRANEQKVVQFSFAV